MKMKIAEQGFLERHAAYLHAVEDPAVCLGGNKGDGEALGAKPPSAPHLTKKQEIGVMKNCAVGVKLPSTPCLGAA